VSVELPLELEREPAIAPLAVDSAAVFARHLGRDRLARARIGRRARSLVSLHKGKYARHRLARHRDQDVAVDATLRAAAARRPELPVRVEAQDLRRKVREHRSPYAVCFVLDNSWSIHAERMVEKAKGVVFELLEEASARGDRVALVAFRGGVPEATVALPLTRSLALARRRLERVPLSGQTPLADALRLGRRLLRQELFKHPNAVPLLVAVTDGQPTVALRPGGDPLADALAEARALRRAHVRCVVADTDGRGHAEALAEAAGAACLPLERLTRETLVASLRGAACRRRPA
jgi:magnesium chelatase subunit D